MGHAAIQHAEWAGATLIATVRGDRKAELARLAGAHTVINYRTDDVVTAVHQAAPGGVDTIVDANAPANIDSDVRVLKPSGTNAIYTANPGQSVTVPIRESMTKNVLLVHPHLHRYRRAEKARRGRRLRGPEGRLVAR